jgi:hypothetical protein
MIINLAGVLGRLVLFGFVCIHGAKTFFCFLRGKILSPAPTFNMTDFTHRIIAIYGPQFFSKNDKDIVNVEKDVC